MSLALFDDYKSSGTTLNSNMLTPNIKRNNKAKQLISQRERREKSSDKAFANWETLNTNK